MVWSALAQLHWPAVVAAGTTYFVLGAIWYQPFAFGTAWMRASGVQMPIRSSPHQAVLYAAPWLAELIAAAATGVLARATGSRTLTDGIALGLLLGLGYAATICFIWTVFDPQRKPQPIVFGLINGGYHVLGFLLMSIIVSAWT